MSTTLVDLLANALVLYQVIPYLPVQSVLRLGATSRAFHGLIHNTPGVFRHLDLSDVPVASEDPEEADPNPFESTYDVESLDSEPDVQPETDRRNRPRKNKKLVPLRKPLLRALQRQSVLQDVQTLVLDGLRVPSGLLEEIGLSKNYQVRILSVRECKFGPRADDNDFYFNKHHPLLLAPFFSLGLVFPSARPSLRAIYLFGAKDPPAEKLPSTDKGSSTSGHLHGSMARLSLAPLVGVTASLGAQIGAEWNQRLFQKSPTSSHLHSNSFYQPTGYILDPGMASDDGANKLIRTAMNYFAGQIVFDAVLCRGPCDKPAELQPNHDALARKGWRPSDANVASVALGRGCAKCHTSPEGPPRFPTAPSYQLPLIAPPPLHSSTVRAAQTPFPVNGDPYPPLFVRCEACLEDRWCKRCMDWWCEDCYTPPSRGSATTGSLTTQVEQALTADSPSGAASEGSIKMGIAHFPDCYECGRCCVRCQVETVRFCKSCRSPYCIEHNDGCNETTCCWCNSTRRRTREDY